MRAEPSAPLDRTTLLVVDDDRYNRAGIRDVFAACADLEVVGEVEDGDEVVEAVARLRPHVVLMDLRMRRVGGLEATRAVVALPHPPAVVAMTAMDTDGLVLQALEAGAVSFLSKDEPPEVFHSYVRSVAAGHAIVRPQQLAELARAGAASTATTERAARAVLAKLSARERDVLGGIAGGRTNAEIAGALFLAETTVKTHVSAIYTKLGTTNRVLAAWAGWRAGLGPSD